MAYQYTLHSCPLTFQTKSEREQPIVCGSVDRGAGVCCETAGKLVEGRHLCVYLFVNRLVNYTIHGGSGSL